MSSPAVITTSALTPRRPHLSATAHTAAGGTATTARSTGSGSAVTDRTHGTASMCAACGLTAYTRP